MIENQQKVLVQVIGKNGAIRNSALEQDLKAQGIDFSIVDGVFPSQKEFESGALHSKILSTLICQRRIRIGEVGCALAHRKTAFNLINSDFEYSIVLEDDAQVIDSLDLATLVDGLNSSEPRVLILGWIPGYAVAFNSPAKVNEYFELATPSTCTFAYALNRSAAKILINQNRKIIDLADWPIYLFNKVRFLILRSPWFDASHDPVNSTIGSRVSNQPQNLIGKLISRFRLLISIIFLLIFSKFINSGVALIQIINRMIIKDQIYGFGRRNLKVNASSPELKNLVFINQKYRKFSTIK